MCGLPAALLLVCVAVLSASAGDHVIREQSCDFEPASVCGWTVLSPFHGQTGVASADSAPPLGPHVDVDPGTNEGHYFYYLASSVPSIERVLVFPSHQYVCELSFSYYLIGPLELDLLLEGRTLVGVTMQQNWTESQYSNTSSWGAIALNISTGPRDEDVGGLILEVSEFDLGEAVDTSPDIDLFFSVDNLTLTFCLPCDFDALSQPGGLTLDAPSDIAIPLRLVSHAEHVVNASSSVCPNSTLVYSIESVQPDHLSPIFTLNPATGELTIDATGPSLLAAGTSGTLNVGVFVPGSNYQQTAPPHKTYILIPFSQPPTIAVTAPASLNIAATLPFSFAITSFSALGVALSYGDVVTTPPELANDITVVVAMDNEGATISGQISINETLPFIVELRSAPTITIPISDTFGGRIDVSTTLEIAPSPPIFTRPRYDFTVTEESATGSRLGPVTLIDPNGDGIADLEISEKDLEQSFIFIRVGGQPPFCNYDIVVLVEINFEQFRTFSFEAIATDSVSPDLFSMVPVTIDVLPVNEYPPRFLQGMIEVTISDTQPIGVAVGRFVASDFDDGRDGDIVYHITSGNDDGFFGISAPGFGEVVVQRTPILPHTYTLIITASDEGVPPMTAEGILIVEVITANAVDCTKDQFSPPVITAPSTQQRLEQPVGTTLTLECAHSANPTVRSYRWEHTSTSQGSVEIIMSEGTDGDHYSVAPDGITIRNVTVEDEGFYTCNVTNQCGSDFIIYYLQIMDYPNPPTDLRVTEGPGTTNVSIEWVESEDPPISGAVVRPVQGYVVEIWDVDEDLGEGFTQVATLSADVTSVSLEGLHPGTSYDLRVLATNLAGSTPSDVITIATNASVPKLSYLTATALRNNSILVEWELEYTGGFPITQFEVHISFQSSRTRRAADPLPPDLVYHVDVTLGSLVTREVDQGRSYVVTTTTGNQVGAVQDVSNAYVGHTDSTACGFEENDGSGCPWQLEDGVVVQAADSIPPLPNTDATGNAQGQYVSAVIQPGAMATIVMTYDRAGYMCGYEFSYQLYGNATLVLQTTSGPHVVWSSESSQMEETGWTSISSSEPLFLTPRLNEGVQFVLYNANTSTVESPQVVIDETNFDFCLPCDFEELRSATEFYLIYPNSTEIYLRTAQTINIEAVVKDCSNAALNFSIIRVVPSELGPSFSLVATGNRAVEVTVNPIPSDLAAPRTVGFVVVLVTVIHSDYGPDSEVVATEALLEFTLQETTENCSSNQLCDFEAGVCDWELGGGATVVSPDASPLTALNANTGSYVYAGLPDPIPGTLTLASTTILDNYCAISFSFAISQTIEAQIIVDGAGSIWSSLLAEFAVPAVPTWYYQVVAIDLDAVSVADMRRLSFQVGQAEGFGEAMIDPIDAARFFALDNVTLHACIDCSVPDCSFTSCIPGHYFSLHEDSCISCPPGYYCPNWRDLPMPCPQGTFSIADGAATDTTCQACPANTYALQTGLSGCNSCPTGFDCSNPAVLPILTGGCAITCPAGFSCSGGTTTSTQEPCNEGEYSLEGQLSCQPCPQGFSCADASQSPIPCPAGKTSLVGSTACANAGVSLGAIVGGAVGGVALLSVLLLCAVCCGCYCWRRAKGKSNGDHHQHVRPAKSVTSIGTAGSLGRSSVASASTFNSKEWRGRDTKTLMSYLSNETRDPYCDETSWMDAEAMTSKDTGAAETLVFQNEAFDEEGDDERDKLSVEMRESHYRNPKKTGKKSASRF